MTLDVLKVSAICSWLLSNYLSNFSSERTVFGGQSKKSVYRTYDTLITPSGWAFSLWIVIFVGEALGLLYMCTENSPLSTVLLSFIYACFYQTLWCAAFTRGYMLVSALVLSLHVYSMYLCCNELALSAVAHSGAGQGNGGASAVEKQALHTYHSTLLFICALSHSHSLLSLPAPLLNLPTSHSPPPPVALLAVPFRLHWAWATTTALINWNMALVSFEQRSQGLDIFAAWGSVWLLAGVGSYRALFLCDGVFPAVLAWTFAWMSNKIQHEPPVGVKGDGALLDSLETTFDVLR